MIKNLTKINIIAYILFVIFIFIIFIIPDIPTNTFNLDDKIWYFLQKYLVFPEWKKSYLIITEKLFHNCNSDIHCLNYVSELNSSAGSYFFIGIINNILFYIFSFFHSDEIFNISKTYFIGFLIIHLVSYFFLYLIYYYSLKYTDKYSIQNWYIIFSIILIPLIYIDGKIYNLIISIPIYYSYIPTVYVPRGAMSVFTIGIVYLIIFNKEKLAIFSLIFLIGFHSSQSLLIIAIVLLFYLIKSIIDKKKIIFLLLMLSVFLFNFYLIKDNFFNNSVINNLISLNLNNKEISLTKIINFSSILFLFFIVIKIFLFRFFLRKQYNNFNLNIVILVILFEISIFFSLILQNFFYEMFYNKELNMVMHSFGQFYMRLFGLLIIPIITLNFLFFLINFKKNNMDLVIKKSFILFAVTIFILNYELVKNNYYKTVKNIETYQYELKYYINREAKYIFEENFKKKELKKFLTLDELKYGSPNDIIRPDINDIDLLISIYFKLKNKNG